MAEVAHARHRDLAGAAFVAGTCALAPDGGVVVQHNRVHHGGVDNASAGIGQLQGKALVGVDHAVVVQADGDHLAGLAQAKGQRLGAAHQAVVHPFGGQVAAIAAQGAHHNGVGQAGVARAADGVGHAAGVFQHSGAAVDGPVGGVVVVDGAGGTQGRLTIATCAPLGYGADTGVQNRQRQVFIAFRNAVVAQAHGHRLVGLAGGKAERAVVDGGVVAAGHSGAVLRLHHDRGGRGHMATAAHNKTQTRSRLVGHAHAADRPNGVVVVEHVDVGGAPRVAAHAGAADFAHQDLGLLGFGVVAQADVDQLAALAGGKADGLCGNGGVVFTIFDGARRGVENHRRGSGAVARARNGVAGHWGGLAHGAHGGGNVPQGGVVVQNGLCGAGRGDHALARVADGQGDGFVAFAKAVFHQADGERAAEFTHRKGQGLRCDGGVVKTHVGRADAGVNLDRACRASAAAVDREAHGRGRLIDCGAQSGHRPGGLLVVNDGSASGGGGDVARTGVGQGQHHGFGHFGQAVFVHRDADGLAGLASGKAQGVVGQGAVVAHAHCPCGGGAAGGVDHDGGSPRHSTGAGDGVDQGTGRLIGVAVGGHAPSGLVVVGDDLGRRAGDDDTLALVVDGQGHGFIGLGCAVVDQAHVHGLFGHARTKGEGAGHAGVVHTCGGRAGAGVGERGRVADVAAAIDAVSDLAAGFCHIGREAFNVPIDVVIVHDGLDGGGSDDGAGRCGREGHLHGFGVFGQQVVGHSDGHELAGLSSGKAQGLSSNGGVVGRTRRAATGGQHDGVGRTDGTATGNLEFEHAVGFQLAGLQGGDSPQRLVIVHNADGGRAGADGACRHLAQVHAESFNTLGHSVVADGDRDALAGLTCGKAECADGIAEVTASSGGDRSAGVGGGGGSVDVASAADGESDRARAFCGLARGAVYAPKNVVIVQDAGGHAAPVDGTDRGVADTKVEGFIEFGVAVVGGGHAHDFAAFASIEGEGACGRGVVGASDGAATGGLVNHRGCGAQGA